MPTENKQAEPAFNLDTPDGGRGYIANLFKTVLKRHDYRQYISERLAGDFACTLAQHFEDITAREAALQHRLTAADERVDALEQEVERLNSVKLALKELAESRADNCSVYRRHLSEALTMAEKVRDACLGMRRKSLSDLIVYLYQNSDAALNPTAEGCVHEFIPFTEDCSKCGEPYTAEGASHEA